MSIQRTFDLRLPTGRPLVPLEACMVVADRDEDDLLALIERGDLAWVWDLRSPDAERRELRVWRDSLLAYVHLDTVAHQRLTAEAVYAALLPPRDDLRSTEIQRLFSASQTHVQHLINEKLLPAMPYKGTTRPLYGPNSFTRVKRADVIAFLKAREVRAHL